MNKQQKFMLAFALAMIFVADTAQAQVGGGGGGGLLQPVIQWIVTNIAVAMISVGVLVVGGLLIAGRHTFAAIFTMIVGAIVIANYQNIAALIPVGG